MKFMLRNVMSARNYRPADLAKKMGLSTQVMAQVLDFRRKGTRFETLELAFSALGAEVEVEVGQAGSQIPVRPPCPSPDTLDM